MMRRSRRHRGRRPGFTLVELISTMVVLGVLGSGTSFLIFNAVDGFVEAAVRAELHSDLSITLDRVVREIRKTELDTAAAGIAPNIESVTTEIIVWRDSDDDVYTILKAADQLIFRVNHGVPSVILEDVTDFAVQAYDESNAALGASLSGTGCDPIRRIELTCEITRQGVVETLRTKVFLRATMTGAS